ncbi:MAG: PEGA domain-containing protein [Planctomycetaceae bacterium]|nr:PEGA domain-containing protein [Planctomycetaceae bacterium]
MSKWMVAKRILLLAIVITICFEMGCVRRRMFIRAFQEGYSQPITGAMVYVNKQPVGRTPVTCHFTHYGTMEFTIVKEGFEPLTEYRKVKAPWYQWPGIDFFSEVVWPQEITDTKQIDFQLRPERIMTQDELIDRAESMRRESQALATFRTESGTTTGIINPVTDVPTGSTPFDGSVVAPSNPYGGTGNTPSGTGSIGAPLTPFTNAPVYQN